VQLASPSSWPRVVSGGESDAARHGDVNLEESILRLRGTKTDAPDRKPPIVGFCVPLLGMP
jgi:hypothetical protein